MTEDVSPQKEDYGFGPIQDALMAIYDEFVELAQRHGWRWYMIGGNALGVGRHNGDFIPFWNDDFVSMETRMCGNITHKSRVPIHKWKQHEPHQCI